MNRKKRTVHFLGKPGFALCGVPLKRKRHPDPKRVNCRRCNDIDRARMDEYAFFGT